MKTSICDGHMVVYLEEKKASMMSAPTEKQIKCLSGCLLYFKTDELKKIKIKKYSSTKENSDIPNRILNLVFSC